VSDPTSSTQSTEVPDTWILYRCPEHGLLPRSATHLAFGAAVGSDDFACSYCGGEKGQRVTVIRVGEVAALHKQGADQERQRIEQGCPSEFAWLGQKLRLQRALEIAERERDLAAQSERQRLKEALEKEQTRLEEQAEGERRMDGINLSMAHAEAIAQVLDGPALDTQEADRG
jgi:hypothetical protein